MEKKISTAKTIVSFYKFMAVKNLEAVRDQIRYAAQTLNVKGLILIGTEGINASVCINATEKEILKDVFVGHFGIIKFKESEGTERAFLKLKVRIKPEIVTMGAPELIPFAPNAHLQPKEFYQQLHSQPQILDVRNDYEVKIGKIKNAKDLGLKDFSEFPKKLQFSDLKKDCETLIYCTGGIRCEKAILEMRQQGFTKVSQLEGGILKYFEEIKGESLFEGECFVFDYRVAVDSDLRPSIRFRLCPHCGNPSQNIISCQFCQTRQVVCEDCITNDLHHRTCSKNCAHHSRMRHRSKKHSSAST